MGDSSNEMTEWSEDLNHLNQNVRKQKLHAEFTSLS